MRQITFELLRHGPANNQLLSPLTQYLALCENHAAVTVQVPFEHNQFLYRHRALSYRLGEEARNFQVKDTARVLGDLLGLVPGLVAELNRDPQDTGSDARAQVEPDRLTHLRLVISASELALLPFELALTPDGFPGAGQSLLLQSQQPICITREVRRVAEQHLFWPKQPRVLFAAAAPPNVGPVPTDAHLAVLRRILQPWVAYAETEEERQKRLNELLLVIPDATSESIERACAENQFSHIHILAHGMQYADGFDIRFGIALHNSLDPNGDADIVSGDRLATILRAAQTPVSAGLARPIAVTLASCDTANVGTVSGVGASVAHALHAAGIPIVIASQFPISVAGSIVFVDVLYTALLWCEDPRVALNDLRRRLHSRFPNTHDWASVTAYVSLPQQFDRRLCDIKIDQTMRSIEVAMNYADRATAKFIKAKSSRPTSESPSSLTEEEKATLLEDARIRIEAGRQRLEELLERTQGPQEQNARICGLLASTEKRCAEVYFAFSRVVSQAPQREYSLAGYGLLQKARQHYWRAFLLNRDSSWAVVQYLSLDLLLRLWKQQPPDVTIDRHDEHNSPKALWTLAHVLSVNDIRTRDEDKVEWALGNLTELYLLALLVHDLPVEDTYQSFTDRAVQRARDLVDHAGPDSFAVYSTRRQILRYDDWYSEMAAVAQLAPAIENLLDVLPVSDNGHRRDDHGTPS